MENTASAIKQYIVRELMSDTPDVILGDDEPLIEGGIVDSLGIFLLIAFIESEFGIKIQPENVVLENFATVSSITKLVMLSRQADAEVA